MANLTRSISSKMPKWAKQEIPTGKNPKSGRSRTKQAAWKRLQEAIQQAAADDMAAEAERLGIKTDWNTLQR